MGNNYISDKSFQIIRTNPKLTSNIKINIDTDFNLYLESFNTNKELNNDKYKHFILPQEKFYEDMIPLFYDKLPINIAFDVKDDTDKNIVYTDFSKQFDDMYWSGVKKTEQNKFYKEEFEYFAPLYIKYNDFPTTFLIMRVDDLGVYEQSGLDYNITTTNAENFRPQIIDKWKCVTSFDLTKKSKLGYWINKNFTTNERFPSSAFEFDSNPNVFSKWSGIEYNIGTYTTKSSFVSDVLRYEQPHFKLEKYITDGFKNNNLIFPNIINMNYLFDDNPATPYKYNKYSINRYLGFYVDIEKIDSLTSYRAERIREANSTFLGLQIINNIFMEFGSLSGSISPFFETDEEWDTTRQYYIYIIDDLFEVKRVKDENDEYLYNIISKYDVKIEDIMNDKEMKIEFIETGNFDYKNKINMLNSEFKLEEYLSPTGIKYMPGDLYLIEVDNKYHILELDDNNDYVIRTDYGIISDEKQLKYWIVDENKSTNIISHDKINKSKPLIFDIFKVKFRDVKDFDFNRIDTGFADFDFDQKDEYVETIEEKLYCIDYNDISVPKGYSKYGILNSNYDKRIIASSEYVSDDELYEIENHNLTELWNKNQSINKWGYIDSISHSDYPYKLNNSIKNGSIFNRTTNILLNSPDILSKTNDFYYRIGTFISGDTSGYDFEYKHFETQSLSIETESKKEQQFNLDLYLDAKIDYFNYFFNNQRYINDIDYVEVNQFSIFNNGTKHKLSSTLFKGIKYEILKIVDVIKDSTGKIDKYLANKDDFNQYKFSVIANYRQDYYSDSTYDVLKTDIINNRIKEYPWDSVKTTKANFDEDGIHIFWNKKFQNILVILNLKGVVNPNTLSVNNLTYYDKDKIYTGQNKLNSTISYDDEFNKSLSIANNFMSVLDENLINYYYIDSIGDSGHTLNSNSIGQISTMEDIKSWGNEFSPFKLQTLEINKIKTKINSFIVTALKGPKTNIYDKYKTDFLTNDYEDEFIKVPLARKIKRNEKEINIQSQVHGETLRYNNEIYRYNGSYEPIFKNISLFKPYDYYIIDPLNMSNKKTATLCSGNWLINSCECDGEYNSDLLGLTYTQNIGVFKTLVLSGFNFDFDLTDDIKGIKLNIKRKSMHGPDGDNETYYSGIADTSIVIRSGSTILGDDKAVLNTYNVSGDVFSSLLSDSAQTNYWYNYDHIFTYGDEDDLWSYSWTPQILNDSNLNIEINLNMYKNITGFHIFPTFNGVNIDCVELEIFYAMSGITEIQTTTISRNIQFDTNYSNFGEIDNLIFSKVNEKENMLKLKNTNEDKSIYPMVDEYGYQFDKRFIFKSNWDSDYYIKTKNELDN